MVDKMFDRDGIKLGHELEHIFHFFLRDFLGYGFPFGIDEKIPISSKKKGFPDRSGAGIKHLGDVFLDDALVGFSFIRDNCIPKVAVNGLAYSLRDARIIKSTFFYRHDIYFEKN